MAKNYNFEKLLEEGFENVTQHFYDEDVETNAEFRESSGIKAVIRRELVGETCAWCEALAGVYEYGKHPKEVFSRHRNCDCIVTYETSKERTNVWTKKRESDQRIKRIEFNGNQERFAERSDETSEFKRNDVTITTKRLYGTDIYASDKLNIKKKELTVINNQIKYAMEKTKNYPRKPLIYLLTDSEMGGPLASFNPYKNEMYLSEKLKDISKIIKMQMEAGYARAENHRSTVAHEMFHWEQLQEWMKKNPNQNPSTYIEDIRKYSKQLLDEIGINAANAMEISPYAAYKYAKKEYDEVIAEYRVKIKVR